MVENTLSVGKISEGFVLDHIEAGKSMEIYKYLHLDKLDCCVAIIKNAKSSKMGRKDIMKIECPIDFMDLDILGFIDHNITVNIIQNEKIVEKKLLKLPKEIKNVIRCKNPRCITSIEQGGFIDHNITVNIIQNEKIVEKKLLKLPKEIKNVIRCKNPRCITSIEQGLDHIFVLTDEENQVYRCKYCEEKYRNNK